jgi:acyl-CoA synthetase (NDP forming)
MEYFADDRDTTAIAAYIEGFKSGQRLREAALAALERDVSIVMVKVGRSAVGSSMAASHTAHLTGSDAAHDAFFEQYGITRVSDLDELLEVSNALARLRTPATDGVVVYGMSGGSAAHLGDLVGAAGLDVPRLSQETQDRLKEIIPDYTVVHNPVDNGAMGLYAGTGPKEMDIVLADPVTGILLYAIPGFFAATTLPMIESLEHAREVSDTPIMVIWSGPLTNDPLYERLWNTGIPVMSNMRNAVVATKALVTKHDRRESNAEFIAAARALPEITGTYQGEVEQLDEVASAAWLKEQGINFVEHRSANDIESAVKAADEIGYPVVLKGRGENLTHKSEHGLVEVGLGSAGEVRESARGMVERGHDLGMEGFVVARQAEAGIELLCGITHDPLLGPVVVVGAGGVTAEAIKDISISVLPLLPGRARQMLERLRISPLLDGWRGQPGVEKDALVSLLVKLGEIAASGQVEELDINPVLATAADYVGLDALVRLRR